MLSCPRVVFIASKIYIFSLKYAPEKHKQQTALSTLMMLTLNSFLAAHSKIQIWPTQIVRLALISTWEKKWPFTTPLSKFCITLGSMGCPAKLPE